jgi:bifunctional DNA-binding transcriptional regulator/antitoxin component of YhaV-PrlF toxin-antitoxin module
MVAFLMDVAESTVGTRGITTIPIAIQKALDLKKGDTVIWAVTNQHVEIRKEKQRGK